ncbi:MAG: hypothetical protein IJE74_00885 [Clostridia bacterium]|nr:hypothetical protein [Clostridia bacterium]
MGNKQDMNALKQSLKDKLMAIILLETSKDYKDMDSDLVTECVDFLMELEGKQKLTKAEIEQRVNEIPFKGKVTAIGSYTKKKLRAKRLAVIAAILAFIIALFGIIAIASGDTVSEFFRQMTYSIFKNLDDNPINQNNITFYKSNETKTYSSIEELVKSEEIEILYPSWLPGNEKIVNVMYINDGESESYVFQCNVPEYSVEVELSTGLSENLKSNCVEVKIAGYSVYYRQYAQYIQANFIYKNYRYSVKSDTENNLFKIIENLKEIN